MGIQSTPKLYDFPRFPHRGQYHFTQGRQAILPRVARDVGTSLASFPKVEYLHHFPPLLWHAEATGTQCTTCWRLALWESEDHFETQEISFSGYFSRQQLYWVGDTIAAVGKHYFCGDLLSMDNLQWSALPKKYAKFSVNLFMEV